MVTGAGLVVNLLASSTAARPAERRRPCALDVLICGATFGGWYALMSHTDGFERADVVLLAASALPLAGWRLSPLGAFAASAAAALALAARGQVLWPPLGPAVALYLLTAARDQSSPWSRQAVGTVGALMASYVALLVTAAGWVATDLAHTVVGCAVAWFAGERSRLRRQEIADLHERAHRMAELAAADLRLAIAEERARIARDLHDSAGHALTVISVRAGAARLRGDPDRAQVALTDIETIARETVADIDHIVGTLRAGEASHAPVESPASLASADTLIARHRAAGLHVAVSRDDEPSPLSRAADQAAYRVLQEALTNAARHGTGSATVTISTASDDCLVTVTNPVPKDAPVPAGGHGLAGMRERACLLGGTLTTGRGDGEFRLVLRLPRAGRAP